MKAHPPLHLPAASTPGIGRFAVSTAFGTLSARFHEPQGSDKGAPPVVLWPSLFSTAAVQARLIDLLSTDRRVLAIDPPGHGESRLDRPGALTLASTADATLALADEAGLAGSFHLVGTSWGGLIGIVLAARAEKRLGHLALLNTPFAHRPGGSGSTRWLPLMARLMGRTRMFSNGVARSFFLPATIADARNTEAMAAHRSTFSGGDPHALSAAAHHIFRTREDVWPHLGRIDVPTLVVAGLHDPIYDEGTQREAANRIRGADYLAVEAAHIAAVDAPEQVAAALRDSWKAARAASGDAMGAAA